MNLPEQIAKHLKEVNFGGNWTASNLKHHLEGVTWQQATTQVYGFNTIVTLVYHIHYYIDAVLKVLHGGPLDAKDAHSFNHPPIHSQEDWEILLAKTRTDARHFAEMIAKMPEQQLWENISGEKYGNYYRNIHGIIEHAHYHLGQIVLIKKIIWQDAKN